MIQYMLRRSLIGIILLLVYVSILFFLIQLALPGDYVSQFAMGLSNAESQIARETLGLDQPIFQRYLVWISKLLHGDLGISYSAWDVGMPVKDYIIQMLPASILVFGIGTALAFSIGIFLGKVSAWSKGGLLPGVITVSGIAFYTAFPPWLAFLIITFVASRIGLPVFGIASSFRIREPAFKQYEVLWIMLLSLSLIIAAAVAILSVMVGVLAAMGLSKLKGRAAMLLLDILAIPMMLPALIIGIALLSFFVRVLSLPLGLPTVILGQLVVIVPFVVAILYARLSNFDWSLVESARDLGASPLTAFATITLPIIRPSVVGAALIALALSLDDFVITFFTIGSGNTLPTLVWGMVRTSLDPTINAIATLLLGLSIGSTVLALRLLDYRR